MEYGLIKDTTIQGIADGFRAKGIVPETRKETIYVDSTFLHSGNISSLEEPYYTTSPTYSSNYTITVPGAASLELRIKLGIKESGDSPCDEFRVLDKNNTSVWSTVITRPMPRKDVIKEYTINVEGDTAILDPYNWSGYAMNYGVSAEVFAKDAEGNYITGIFSKEIDVTNTITPEEMVEALTNAPALPPESAFSIAGSCKYKFAFTGWNWFINNYGEKITTASITDAQNMFENNNTLEVIPFDINLKSGCSTQYMFSGCHNLAELPVINNFKPGQYVFQDCRKITSLNGLKIVTGLTAIALADNFSGCYRLRSIGEYLDDIPDELAGDSIFGMYRTFNGCYAMDEILNLPYVYSTYGDSYFFTNCFSHCYRVKDITFRNQVVKKTGLKSAVLDLSTYTGWSDKASNLTNIGFPAELEAKDEASYEAVKNHPDWWTSKVEYSRYNHDSAVNTINSLPDIQSVAGARQTIKFKKAAGSMTDGGAIENLTPEEIAIADAKGWTVTLV